MDDLTSLYSVEDDGSLLILSKISEEVDAEIAGDMEQGKHDTSDSWHCLEVSKQGLKTDNESLDAGLDALLDDESLWGIQQILTKEQQNLDLIRKSNEMIKKIISGSPTSSSIVSPDDGSEKVAKERVISMDSPSEKVGNDETDVMSPNNVNAVAVKPYQKLIRRFSNNFQRRRQPNRLNRANNPVDVQTFIQDYYKSLSTVSRYIIVACVLGFCTAFLLLSWYSSQTHSQDIELFRMQEKQVLANQESYQRYQREHENFRESLIHQRYEESRECHSLLETCHSKRDELLAQISRMEQNAGKSHTKLEAKLESQRKEIQALQGKLRDFEAQNKELRKEIGQSFSSFYAQFLLSILNILKNRSIQFAIGTGITVVVFIGLFCASFGK